MNYLSVENLSKSYGEKPLFRNISFGIAQGEKVALVASNGAGKSTLLRILQGKEIADSGTAVFRNDIRVAFLDQDPHFPNGQTVYEALFHSNNPLLQCVRNYELRQEQYNLHHTPGSETALQEAMMEMDALQAWDYESKIKQILAHLNIHNLEQFASQLSGGQQKRLALARVLIEEPQFLIMDEPTNHLDIDMIEWLEAYFIRNDMTLLLVTHDRYFLDNVCTDIMEMEAGNMYKYKGNYEYFLEKKAEREFNEARELDKAKNLYRRELEWVRKMPRARGTKSKSRIEAFETLQEKVKGKKKGPDLQLNVKMNRIGGKILELKNVGKRYGDKVMLKGFDYTFKKGERIGIVGKNGVGKTTLLNIITGKEQADVGKVNVGDTIVFGYYAQQGIQLKEDMRVIEVVKEIADVIPLADGTKVSASQFLQLFQFTPDMQFTFVSKLSGGEKKRLFLLTVLIKNPNFLILDEPTNDLDLVTLNILEEFLQNFQGCLLMVSHDRYFMDKLVDQLFVFEGDGVVNGFIGNYAEYRMEKAEEDREKIASVAPLSQEKEKVVSSSAGEAAVEKPQAQTRQKLSYKEKYEFEQLEKDIPELENKKAKLSDMLNSGITDHVELMRITGELQTISDELDEKGMRWLELSERL